jgi:ribosomal protein L30E
LGSFAAALYARFRRTRDMSDLDEAVLLLREAVETCPKTRRYCVSLLSSLSAMLITRFDVTSRLQDLQEAMERRHNGLQVAIWEEANKSILLASKCHEKFEETGHITHLERAISLLRKGLARLPVHHPGRLPGCNILASVLSAGCQL